MVVCFHHTDLDGVGVNVLSNYYANYTRSKYREHGCSWKEIDAVIRRSKDQITNSEITIIGDISPKLESTHQFLSSTYSNKKNILLVDHHSASVKLNKYPWAVVSQPNKRECGTSMLFEFLRDLCPSINKATDLVEVIRQFDTFRWFFQRPVDGHSTHKSLSVLLSLIGCKPFTRSLLDNAFNIEVVLDQYSGMLTGYEKSVEREADYVLKQFYDPHLTIYPITTDFMSLAYTLYHNGDMPDVLIGWDPWNQVHIFSTVGIDTSVIGRQFHKVIRSYPGYTLAISKQYPTLEFIRSCVRKSGLPNLLPQEATHGKYRKAH